MQIALLKSPSPTERERVWVTRPDGWARRIACIIEHDLPHLVVESVFEIEHGFWGLVAAGAFTVAPGVPGHAAWKLAHGGSEPLVHEYADLCSAVGYVQLGRQRSIPAGPS